MAWNTRNLELIRLVEKRLLPPPTDCVLTGVYPGIEDSLDLAEVN